MLHYNIQNCILLLDDFKFKKQNNCQLRTCDNFRKFKLNTGT